MRNEANERVVTFRAKFFLPESRLFELGLCFHKDTNSGQTVVPSRISHTGHAIHAKAKSARALVSRVLGVCIGCGSTVSGIHQCLIFSWCGFANKPTTYGSTDLKHSHSNCFSTVQEVSYHGLLLVFMLDPTKGVACKLNSNACF